MSGQPRIPDRGTKSAGLIAPTNRGDKAEGPLAERWPDRPETPACHFRQARANGCCDHEDAFISPQMTRAYAVPPPRPEH